MRFSKCTTRELNKALEVINQKYDGNVIYNREPSDTDKRFTLRVVNSREPGSRLGLAQWQPNHKPRHLINACWHVHGDFFDALFTINPGAVIYAGPQKITKDFGNWEDRNIGSTMVPFQYSEACECKETGLDQVEVS